MKEENEEQLLGDFWKTYRLKELYKKGKYVVDLKTKAAVYAFSSFNKNELEDIVNVISIIYFFNILLKKPNFINNKVYLITVIVGFAFKMIQPSFFSSGEILLSLCSFTVVPYFYNYYELSKNK